MATTLEELVIKLSADSAKYQAGMKKAKQETAGFGNRIKKLEKSSLLSFKNIGIAAGAMFAKAAIKNVTNAFVRQEQSIFQLEQRLKSTQGASGKTSEGLQRMAAALQKTTVFGDEATMEMQSLLLTFTQIQGPVFDKATVAIQNVATAMGTDLKSAALQVGKALNDPKGQLSALSRSGIQFTKTQKDTIKSLVEMGDTAGAQTIILKELETQFGGAAEAAAMGLGGALKQAENAMGDAAETMGGVLAPAIVVIANEIKSMSETTEGATPEMAALGAVFNTLTISALTMKEMFGGVVQSLGAIAAAGAFLLEGEFKLAKNVFNQHADDTEKRILALAEKIKNIDLFGLKEGQKIPALALPEAVGGVAPVTVDTAAQDRVSLEEKQKVAMEAALLEQEQMMAGFAFAREQQEIHDAMMMEQKVINAQTRADMRAQEEQEIIAGLQRQAAAETQIEQFKMKQKQQFAGNAIALLTMLGGKNKVAAIAAIGLQKALAIGQTITATLAAQMMAMAQLGPIAGPPAAASIGAWGAANVGIIAATGLLQAGSVGGGGSGGSLGAGGGGQGSDPGFAPQQSPDIGLDQASISRAITINFHGFVGDLDQLAREVIPSITKAIGDGKQVEVFA